MSTVFTLAANGNTPAVKRDAARVGENQEMWAITGNFGSGGTLIVQQSLDGTNFFSNPLTTGITGIYSRTTAGLIIFSAPTGTSFRFTLSGATAPALTITGP